MGNYFPFPSRSFYSCLMRIARARSKIKTGPSPLPARRGAFRPRWRPGTSWSFPTATARRSACWLWRACTTRTCSRPYPFDVPRAQTQGMIGYWLA